MDKKVWLITGVSRGLGKAIFEEAKANGNFVIGTFRKQEEVEEFNRFHEENALAVLLDLSDESTLINAVDKIKRDFGRLDVLVNNAGYGMAGAIEETSIEETRQLFEANFFGTLRLTQLVLPIMREQRAGHIIQMSSHGGVKAFPGFGIYNASKFALEGFSEALAQEVGGLGIKVTIVEPGPFRTGFAGDAFALVKNQIDDYENTSGLFRTKIKAVDGKQEGDPQKAAKAILNIVNVSNPPLRLPLGKVALGTISAKLSSVQSDLDQYRELAEGAVFDS